MIENITLSELEKNMLLVVKEMGKKVKWWVNSNGQRIYKEHTKKVGLKEFALTLLCTGGDTLYPPLEFHALVAPILIRGPPNIGTIPIS